MAKKKEDKAGTEIEYGKTGYGVNLSEEGKDPIDGNFITDEDLKEYQELKAAKQTGQFITNDEAAEYQQFKKGKEEQASKEEMQKQQAATIAINKLGANPVKAVTADGRQTNWSRKAWDELPFETDSKGKELKTKLGGWFVKADTPEEVKQFRNEQSVATQ